MLEAWLYGMRAGLRLRLRIRVRVRVRIRIRIRIMVRNVILSRIAAWYDARTKFSLKYRFGLGFGFRIRKSCAKP